MVHGPRSHLDSRVRFDAFAKSIVVLNDLAVHVVISSYNEMLYSTPSIPACPGGTYGANCQHECKCSNHGECDPVSGACTCLPGWHGERCQHACGAGAFGRGCGQQCRCKHGAECRRADGFCYCTAGYMGTYCGESEYTLLLLFGDLGLTLIMYWRGLIRLLLIELSNRMAMVV